MSKKVLKPIFSGHVIIVFKHRKQKTFAESSRPQKKKKISRVFKHGYAICPVAVKQVFSYDLIEIAYTVRKSHDHPSNIQLGSSLKINYPILK
jgi:hypothetical protein